MKQFDFSFFFNIFQLEYFVKWQGYDDDENSWVKETDMLFDD